MDALSPCLSLLSLCICHSFLYSPATIFSLHLSLLSFLPLFPGCPCSLRLSISLLLFLHKFIYSQARWFALYMVPWFSTRHILAHFSLFLCGARSNFCTDTQKLPDRFLPHPDSIYVHSQLHCTK